MNDLRRDWRYSPFLEYHRGLRFQHSPYTSEHRGDDDHCIACWQKLGGSEYPGIQHDGYVTRCDIEYPGEGIVAQNRWVCNVCWTDLCDFMNWQEEPPAS
jgi:hypothetical protein